MTPRAPTPPDRPCPPSAPSSAVPPGPAPEPGTAAPGPGTGTGPDSAAGSASGSGPVSGPGSASGTGRHGIRAAWIMLASGWSGNQFSALLGAYRTESGLSESTVTGLFALYVVGLAPGLLLGGPLADRTGRRPVALLALALNLLSTCMLMVGAAHPAWLLAGRFVTGVSAGALLAAGSAWIKELSAGAAEHTAARRAGLFVSGGFATGGLVAALIAQWAPHPMVTAYLPHLALTLAAGVAALPAPETLPGRATGRATGRTPGHAPRRPPEPPHPDGPGPAAPAPRQHAVPTGPTGPTGPRPHERPRHSFARSVLPLAPWVFAAPTIGFATLPGLVDGGLDGWRTVYAGLATAVVPGSGLLAQPPGRRLAARHPLAPALAALVTIALGLVLAVLATLAAAAHGPALALLAAAVLGAGYGLALSYGLTRVAALAPPDRLARLTAHFWTLAYTGMFAPYVVTLLSGPFDPPVLLGAGAVLALLTGVLLAVLHRTPAPRRPDAGGAP
ncbi:MFS transporter [Streptomyces cacaoi]|uniref:MFS transporter n=1 Tax=Streptomyces cacaoi TaxID=1898 RepID=UPI001FD2A1E2|nr:MFS transporter [Streptomyces cacaoi]